MLIGLKMNEDDLFLTNCAKMHTILRDNKHFLQLTLTKVNVSIIFVTINLIEGSGRVNIMLSNGTKFHINDSLYSSKSKRK